jgi:hypothetical protein
MRQFSKIYKIFPVETTFHGSPQGGGVWGALREQLRHVTSLHPGRGRFLVDR